MCDPQAENHCSRGSEAPRSVSKSHCLKLCSLGSLTPIDSASLPGLICLHQAGDTSPADVIKEVRGTAESNWREFWAPSTPTSSLGEGLWLLL